MLRLIFVLAIVVIGGTLALQGAFPALLFYLWIAYFRPEAWVWHGFLASMQLSFLAGGYLVLRALFDGGAFRLNGRTGLLLVFLLHSGISLLFSAYTSTALWHFELFAKAVLVTWFIANLTTDAKRYRLVLLVMGLSLGFEGAKQGWATLILHPGGANTNPNPFLGDNNGVAVGMLMLVPVLVALAHTSEQRWERILHRFLSVGVLYRALSTYSRGGFLACGALMILHIMRTPRKLRTILGILLVATVVLPVMPDTFWDRMRTITATEDERDSSAAGRVYFWRLAVDMASAAPLTGVGFNSYNDAYNSFDRTDGLYGSGRSVHSSWFGVLAELGYPGLILQMLILISAFRTSRTVRRLSAKGEIGPELGRYAVALEGSLVVFVVGGTFLPYQYNEMAWHVFGLGIALRNIAEKELATATATSTPEVQAAPVRRFTRAAVPAAALSTRAGASRTFRTTSGRR